MLLLRSARMTDGIFMIVGRLRFYPVGENFIRNKDMVLVKCLDAHYCARYVRCTYYESISLSSGMYIPRIFCRRLHTTCHNEAVKSNLAKLRKKTGYTLSLCRQALETTNQDLAKAEQWLNVKVPDEARHSDWSLMSFSPQ